jgi:hypothetical protein
VGDFNGDGKLDLAVSVAGSASRYTQVFLGNGDDDCDADEPGGRLSRGAGGERKRPWELQRDEGEWQVDGHAGGAHGDRDAGFVEYLAD